MTSLRHEAAWTIQILRHQQNISRIQADPGAALVTDDIGGGVGKTLRILAAGNFEISRHAIPNFIRHTPQEYWVDAYNELSRLCIRAVARRYLNTDLSHLLLSSPNVENSEAPAQDGSELSIDDEQLLQIMHDHVRSLNESVVKTIEKIEGTIDALTSEERPANNGRD